MLINHAITREIMRKEQIKTSDKILELIIMPDSTLKLLAGQARMKQATAKLIDQHTNMHDKIHISTGVYKKYYYYIIHT